MLDRKRFDTVAAFLKERGYHFTVNNIDYVADARRKPSGRCAGQYQYLTGYNERGQAVDSNRYRIDGSTSFRHVRYGPILTFRGSTLYYRGLNIIAEASEPASGHSASVGAALSQLRLAQLGAGEPRLYR